MNKESIEGVAVFKIGKNVRILTRTNITSTDPHKSGTLHKVYSEDFFSVDEAVDYKEEDMKDIKTSRINSYGAEASVFISTAILGADGFNRGQWLQGILGIGSALASTYLFHRDEQLLSEKLKVVREQLKRLREEKAK